MSLRVFEKQSLKGSCLRDIEGDCFGGKRPLATTARNDIEVFHFNFRHYKNRLTRRIQNPATIPFNMRSDIKYLGTGLLIGVGVTGLAIAGFITAGILPPLYVPTPEFEIAILPEQPTDIPFATIAAVLIPDAALTPTSTPTNLPVLQLSTPYDTPAPTSSLSAAQSMMDSGQLMITGPLTEYQQKNLYDVSMQYVEPTTRGSLYLSKEINGVKYGNASNTCGPLAIAILRDAGVLSADIIAHDFWLLNPSDPLDRRIINRTFPNNRFIHAETKFPLTKIDWKTFPLQPGDFMYIKSGTGGNFDHMLTVTRVDKNLRVYAVTNYATTNGFVITEVMLYDPNDPKAGIFHTWTQRANQLLGSTGFGGFEIWRPRGTQ